MNSEAELDVILYGKAIRIGLAELHLYKKKLQRRTVDSILPAFYGPAAYSPVESHKVLPVMQCEWLKNSCCALP